MIDHIRSSSWSLFGIVAIALSMSAMPLAAKPEMMTIELCSADGAVRNISIPVERDNGKTDCAKPCHACLSRKKNAKS